MPGLYLVLGPDYAIVEASDVYLLATQKERAEVLGRSVFDVAPYAPGDLAHWQSAGVRSSVDRVFSTGRAEALESLEFGATTSPVRADDGGVAFVIHKIDDAAGAGAAREPATHEGSGPPAWGRLRHRSAAAVGVDDRSPPTQADFLALVSHEFRTPLTTIWLDLQRLERQSDALAPRHQQAVLRMASAARRLQTLIEAFLEYGHIQSGQLVTRTERFDLASLVRELVGEYDRHKTRRELTLRCAVARQHPIESDPVLVRLILANLVDNAVKFTQRGVVEVGAWVDDRGHRIVVRDTGPGIAPEHLRRIFEPFEQVSPLHNKSVPGVGLGLSIVRAVAEALDGHAEARSVPGLGSMFSVWLPRAPGAECEG
jgi:signal transduction histidine kinase